MSRCCYGHYDPDPACEECKIVHAAQAIDPAFVDDWNSMVEAMAAFAERHAMPKPTLVFAPAWKTYMEGDSGETLASTLIWRGVRVRFALWQQGEALKEI